MQIRPATPDDAAAVDELVQRAYAHYVHRIRRRPGPMNDDYRKKVAEGNVSVAVEADEVIGLIVLVEEPDHLLVENVAVEPERQSQGIGRALLAFAEEVTTEAGLTTLRLYTHALMTENLTFYPRLGYTEIDRRTDNGFERVFFAKHLHGETVSGKLITDHVVEEFAAGGEAEYSVDETISRRSNHS